MSGISWLPRPPPSKAWEFRAQVGFTEGIAEFAKAPLREPARVPATLV